MICWEQDPMNTFLEHICTIDLERLDIALLKIHKGTAQKSNCL